MPSFTSPIRALCVLGLLTALGACAPEPLGDDELPLGAGGIGATDDGTGGIEAAGGAGGDDGPLACVPDRPCSLGCDPCTGSCDRGTLDPATCTCTPPPVHAMRVLRVNPPALELTIDELSPLRVFTRRADCSELEVTGNVTWEISNTKVATIGPSGVVAALAPGRTELFANLGGARSQAVQVTVEGPPRPRELRGIWVTRYALTSAEAIEAIIDRAAAANFNAVFLQIRGAGDAYYRSDLVPWARDLTGVLGRDPGWDPLQVAIDRAHLHGMELHAYFNALSAWAPAGSEVPAAEGEAQHALFSHPEWECLDEAGARSTADYRWFSPGSAELRAHLVAVTEELLSRYEVDGYHLDRIRTPGRAFCRDPLTLAAFEAARRYDATLPFDDFLREMINTLVDELGDAVRRIRPQARSSAAVWGIYEPLPGCNTSAGLRDYHQDSLEWLSRSSIDALAPMIYWPVREGACTDFATLLDGFVAARAGGEIWAGMHALDTVDGESGFFFDEVKARIEASRAAGATGTIVFASSYLDESVDRWQTFVGDDASPGPYAEAADPRSDP